MLKLYYCDVSKMTDEEFARLCTDTNKSPNQKLSLAGGALIKNAIAQEFDIDKENVTFKRTQKGKPYTESVDVEFSISHSGDIVVCAVSDNPVGIDIEKIREVNLNVAKRLFTPDEQEYIFEKNSKQRFFEVWTKKEAYVKLLGLGITYFPKFSVMRNENIETYVKKHYILSVAKAK